MSLTQAGTSLEHLHLPALQTGLVDKLIKQEVSDPHWQDCVVEL